MQRLSHEEALQALQEVHALLIHSNSGLLGLFFSLHFHGDRKKRGQLEWKPNEMTGLKIIDRPQEPLP